MCFPQSPQKGTAAVIFAFADGDKGEDDFFFTLAVFAAAVQKMQDLSFFTLSLFTA